MDIVGLGCGSVKDGLTVTVESSTNDDAIEGRDKNRAYLCGTRRTWYAPGVGLVRLAVQTADGTEALIQLNEFSVEDSSDDCFPLAIGNSWTYIWADIPPEYFAKETYRVAAQEGDLWYLQSTGYACKV